MTPPAPDGGRQFVLQWRGGTACVYGGRLHKGPYIKDVRNREREGGSPKADIVGEVAWILLGDKVNRT